MTITPFSILKHSSKFTGVNLLSRLLSFPVSIVVAMVLSPKDYGIIGYAGVFVSWAGFVNLGMMSAAQREMPGLIESGNVSRARLLQNQAITIESVITVAVFLGLLFIAGTFEDFVTKVILMLSAVGFAVGRFYNFLEGINFAFKDFNLSAKGRLVRGVLYPVLTIALIFWLKIYTPPIVGLLLGLTVIMFLFKKRAYEFSLVFNKSEAFRLAKIGLSLTGGTILYTVFTGTLDKTVISAYLSKAELGLWVFSYTLVTLVLGFFKDYANVLKPVIWGHASNVAEAREGFSVLKEMGIYFSLASAFCIGLVQLGFIFLVNFVIVKFTAAQYVFLFMSLYIFWECMEKFPELVLFSAKTNRQNSVLLVWGTCIGINLLLDILAIKLGYGIVGIAVATTISQVVSTLLMYTLASRYLFHDRHDFMLHLFKVITPFFISLAFTLFHWVLLTGSHVDIVVLLTFSFLSQVLIWHMFARLFYANYYSVELVQQGARKIARKARNYLRR